MRDDTGHNLEDSEIHIQETLDSLDFGDYGVDRKMI